MEPAAKRAKITDHFRVALKPHDANIHRPVKKGALLATTATHTHSTTTTTTTTTSKVAVITIADEEEYEIKENRTQQQARQESKLAALFERQQQHIQNHQQQQHQHRESLTKRTQHKPQHIEQKISSQQVALDKLSSSTPNVYTTPPGLNTAHISDHDRTLVEVFQYEPYYAWDSFDYDRQRELMFRTCKYITQDYSITPKNRAKLVDWLAYIQDNNNLDHEVLYMAVKITDRYLMRKNPPRDQLPLLYMTAILISAKFDERIPPLMISDLTKQSRIKYTRKQVKSFEEDVLITLDFDIRYPLSYGFLRRYAQCTRSDRLTLNLARYILESSLLNYEMIDILESKMAASCLLLAFRFLKIKKDWTAEAEFYTGYKKDDLEHLVEALSAMISRPLKGHINRKYSDKVFMSVAGIPPLAKSQHTLSSIQR